MTQPRLHLRRFANRCLLTRGALLLAAAVVASPSAYAQPGAPASPVVVAPVEQREVAARGIFVGTAMPRRRAVVGSAVDGRVLEYPIDAGDRVVARQPLAQLRTKTIEISIAEANAELEIRRQELAELKAGSRPEEIGQAKAKALAAQALMTYAKSKFERTNQLFQQGRTISQEELDDAQSRYTNLTQLFELARENYELVLQGPRKEQIAQAEARVASQQEAVNFLEDRKKKYTIIAPFDGYVVAEHTQVGEWVTQGQDVAEVIELDPIEIEVFVPESSVVYQRAGSSVPITFEAIPGEQFEGKIVRVVPQANVRSRSFPVRIQLPNPQRDGTHLLRAGMFARVGLTTGGREMATLVPKDALVLGGVPTIFVVDLDPQNSGIGTARPVTVTPGIAEGSMIQVRADLKPGQLVVTQGNERLRPQQSVRIMRTESATSAER